MSSRCASTLFVVLAAIVLLTTAGVASAANAKISAIVLEVSHRVGPDGTFVTSTLGAQLPAGSRVRTGPRGKAEVKFADGSSVRMGPRSDMVVTDPTTKKVKVMAGQVFANIISGTGGAQIQGATATAAVRGTQVLVEVTEPVESEEWVTTPEADQAELDPSWEGLRTFGQGPVVQGEVPAETATMTASQMRTAMVGLAKSHLAQRLGIRPGRIYLASLEPVVWPDAALGCAVEGQSYAQVETPGYKVLLDSPQGFYNYATDTRGRVITD
ncbi:MAG TPA: hypothetical protein DEP45_14240, partial [Armatimonadetes bacterium]|nr:hypothetical protein [Armatimonadota bacterium]